MGLQIMLWNCHLRTLDSALLFSDLKKLLSMKLSDIWTLWGFCCYQATKGCFSDFFFKENFVTTLSRKAWSMMLDYVGLMTSPDLKHIANWGKRKRLLKHDTLQRKFANDKNLSKSLINVDVSYDMTCLQLRQMTTRSIWCFFNVWPALLSRQCSAVPMCSRHILPPYTSYRNCLWWEMTIK